MSDYEDKAVYEEIVLSLSSATAPFLTLDGPSFDNEWEVFDLELDEYMGFGATKSIAIKEAIATYEKRSKALKEKIKVLSALLDSEVLD